jgi:hypothetical protein
MAADVPCPLAGQVMVTLYTWSQITKASQITDMSHKVKYGNHPHRKKKNWRMTPATHLDGGMELSSADISRALLYNWWKLVKYYDLKFVKPKFEV